MTDRVPFSNYFYCFFKGLYSLTAFQCLSKQHNFPQEHNLYGKNAHKGNSKYLPSSQPHPLPLIPLGTPCTWPLFSLSDPSEHSHFQDNEEGGLFCQKLECSSLLVARHREEWMFFLEERVRTRAKVGYLILRTYHPFQLF